MYPSEVIIHRITGNGSCSHLYSESTFETEWCAAATSISTPATGHGSGALEQPGNELDPAAAGARLQLGTSASQKQGRGVSFGLQRAPRFALRVYDMVTAH